MKIGLTSSQFDVEFTLNFGHPTSQLKFNQISTSYDVVCLLGIICYVSFSRRFYPKRQVGEHLTHTRHNPARRDEVHSGSVVLHVLLLYSRLNHNKKTLSRDSCHRDIL